MMSQFSDDFAAAGFGPLLEQFGEDVVYTPPPSLTPGVAPVPRTIRVIIKRDPIELLSRFAGTLTCKMSVKAANDSVLGIPATDLAHPGATITVTYIPGGDAEAFLVRRSPEPGNQTGAALKLVL